MSIGKSKSSILNTVAFFSNTNFCLEDHKLIHNCNIKLEDIGKISLVKVAVCIISFFKNKHRYSIFMLGDIRLSERALSYLYAAIKVSTI